MAEVRDEHLQHRSCLHTIYFGKRPGEMIMMTNAALTHTDRIIQDPTIMVGKPVVRGTRIPVEVVLEYLAHNPDFAELFADYPRLTMDDVTACLEYARTLVREEAHVTEAASTA